MQCVGSQYRTSNDTIKHSERSSLHLHVFLDYYIVIDASMRQITSWGSFWCPPITLDLHSLNKYTRIAGGGTVALSIFNGNVGDDLIERNYILVLLLFWENIFFNSESNNAT